tara:strand:+ start:224 stop:559 length:336 start_codon:yes stop_codon:yes gene_type:complete
MKFSKSNILTIILFSIILILSYIIIFRKSEPIGVLPFDDTELLNKITISDSIITYWKYKSIGFENKALYFKTKADSLQLLKPQINNYYDQIYKFNSTASGNELDSVIRANW